MTQKRHTLLKQPTFGDFSHQKCVSFSVFFGFLQLATALVLEVIRYLGHVKEKDPGRILTQNTPKHVVPPKDVPFWGREHKIYHLDPHFPELVPFWGLFLTGLRKFSPKNRLTMEMLTLEHLLIVIVDA